MDNTFTIYNLPLETPALLQTIERLESPEFAESMKVLTDKQRLERQELTRKVRLQGLMGPAFAEQAAKIEAHLAQLEPDPALTAHTLANLYTQLVAARERDAQLVAGAMLAAGYDPLSFEDWELMGRVSEELRAAGINLDELAPAAPVGSSEAGPCLSAPVRRVAVGASPAQTTPAPTTNPPAAPAPEASSKLSLRQVALLYFYTGRVIPPNADAIAKQYGHESGRTLYKRYLQVVQTAGRVGDEITGPKLGPMIADISAIISRLTGPALQQAESELQTLLVRKGEK